MGNLSLVEVDLQPPKAAFRCWENCNGLVIVDKEMWIEASCPFCQSPTYRWQLLVNDSSVLKDNYPLTPQLKIPKWFLFGRGTRTFMAQVESKSKACILEKHKN
jgi:hypothetical protein